jgi:MFS family permease
MNRIKLPGLALVVMLAFTSVVTALASAAGNVLPVATKASPLSFITTSGAVKFGSGLTTVTATSSLAEASGESEKEGTSHLALFGATSALGTCTTAGDAAGVILAIPIWHWTRPYLVNGTWFAAWVLLLLTPIQFSCGSVPVVVSGCLAGALSPESILTTLLTATFAVSGSDNKIISVLNEAETGEVTCQLLASVNGGATVLSSVEVTGTLSGFKKGGVATEVLVML